VREVGFLSRRQRRLAWVGFGALAVHAPLMAWLVPDDTWLLSVTVSGLVAMVIIADDTQRRDSATPDTDG
jgi:membrane protein implicated in regulation of membrane protease activity